MLADHAVNPLYHAILVVCIFFNSFCANTLFTHPAATGAFKFIVPVVAIDSNAIHHLDSLVQLGKDVKQLTGRVKTCTPGVAGCVIHNEQEVPSAIETLNEVQSPGISMYHAAGLYLLSLGRVAGNADYSLCNGAHGAHGLELSLDLFLSQAHPFQHLEQLQHLLEA